MEQFIFYRDRKITQWERSRFFVTAESYEKALEYIKSLQGEDLEDHILEFFDCETLDGTDEFITVEENNGQATIEVLDRDFNVVYDNKKRPKIALDDSGVTIPKNDYEQPIQIRQDVVQGICEAFLSENGNSIFHPFSNGCYRTSTLALGKLKNGKWRGFMSVKDAEYDGVDFVRIHGCEMKAAFEVLRKAGYHMFKTYLYGSWLGYVCNKKPYRKDSTEVFEFNEFID